MKFSTFAFLAISLSAPLLLAQENRLRNGSFEGGTLYWHQVEAPEQALVRDAKVGEFALRIAKGNVMSAPFVAERGQPMTVSFFVKGEKPGKVGVQMPPSAREPGTKSKRLWMREGEQSAEITTEWKRVSFTWNADVPQDGFWPLPHYMVQIGGFGQPIFVDGVTVTAGKEGAPDYVPRFPLEVVAECTNLPGYAGAAGNIFEKGAEVELVAHVSNTTATMQAGRISFRFHDYEGNEPMLGQGWEELVDIPANKTLSVRRKMKLPATGTVLARVRAMPHVKNPTPGTFDKSEIPLTSLPYPKAATKPDSRERFGGSFAGGEGMLQKFQRIGFGWTRWFPETKWQYFQKQAGAPLDWHQDKFDLAAKYGVSQHVVLYGWPPGLMDKEHSGQPLPLDMKWPADDPRWNDLSVETAWDKYVKAAATHFRGQSVIFEISNEPEFDKWEKHYGEYAKFNIRTARLIKATDPKAKVMVNNVYGVPSPVNAALFKAKDGLKYVDVISWHDYHAGWLSDANGIKRMKQNIDEAGGKHVELWFNEGWAFTNTAVDEPIACTHLTAAQSTNAHAASVVEMTIAGQEKTILFHTGYEQHGMSFWDYSGPGTMLWDWYDNPLPLVPMWNVLSHHIGISDEVGFVRPPGANLAIFQDLRNGRGVVVAYADRDAKADVVVELPLNAGEPALAGEDVMGNKWEFAGEFEPPSIPANLKGEPAALVSKRNSYPVSTTQKLRLRKTGRVVFLYDGKTTGAEFLKKLAPLDRKHASFVSSGATPTWNLPSTWQGTQKGTANGNPIAAAGQPVWRLDRLFPEDAIMSVNYSPMTWQGTKWAAPDKTHAGHPSAEVENGTLRFAAMGPWNGELNFAKMPALVFIAPTSGTYKITGTASAKPWDGGAKTFPLSFRKKDTQRAAEISAIMLPRDGTPVAINFEAELTAGHELLFVPMLQGLYHNAANFTIKGLSIERKMH